MSPQYFLVVRIFINANICLKCKCFKAMQRFKAMFSVRNLTHSSMIISPCGVKGRKPETNIDVDASGTREKYKTNK